MQLARRAAPCMKVACEVGARNVRAGVMPPSQGRSPHDGEVRRPLHDPAFIRYGDVAKLPSRPPASAAASARIVRGGRRRGVLGFRRRRRRGRLGCLASEAPPPPVPTMYVVITEEGRSPSRLATRQPHPHRVICPHIHTLSLPRLLSPPAGPRAAQYLCAPSGRSIIVLFTLKNWTISRLTVHKTCIWFQQTRLLPSTLDRGTIGTCVPSRIARGYPREITCRASRMRSRRQCG